MMDKKTAFLTNFIQEELYVISAKAEVSAPRKPLVVTESEIDSSQTSFLRKIFSAVGLGPTDFEHQVSSDLPTVEHPVVFYFGSSFQDNPPYTLITTDDGKQRVYAHSLELIQQDQDQKRALWQILKEVF